MENLYYYNSTTGELTKDKSISETWTMYDCKVICLNAYTGQIYNIF